MPNLEFNVDSLVRVLRQSYKYMIENNLHQLPANLKEHTQALNRLSDAIEQQNQIFLSIQQQSESQLSTNSSEIKTDLNERGSLRGVTYSKIRK